MMESSLSFTDGDLCPSVSQYREPIALRYLVEFQEYVERRLKQKKSVISMKGGNKQESPHGKVGDLVVDCLLLRYLFCYE